MSSSASRKGGGNGRVRGRPIQLGEVRNPEGRNQYSYRRDFDQDVPRLLAEGTSDAEIDRLPEWARGVELEGLTRDEVVARIVVAGALRGEGRYMNEVLKRVWPVPKAEPEPEEPPHNPLATDVDLSMLSPESREALKRITHEVPFAGTEPIDPPIPSRRNRED